MYILHVYVYVCDILFSIIQHSDYTPDSLGAKKKAGNLKQNPFYWLHGDSKDGRAMNNLTPEERRALKSLREQKRIERQQQTAHVINQLLMADPLYAQSYAEQSLIPSDTSTSSSSLSSDKQQAVLSSSTLKQDFMVTNKMDLKIDKHDKQKFIIGHKEDMDVVGIIVDNKEK
ncbi:hypothetical protein RFI_09534 [Reticulomyxa filosa]|uniref:Uncharacterized protein n=1 Tax=Reticulomyxa filosa TaxID=46433 RepID=X6NQF6_RETFI|nr:hypothetical protein RFI_09534 [Reticulomyxa filosa]|eukprot:ETO27602.1 hypothetical protein RFI_09534 [Reticulomyxa filosa]